LASISAIHWNAKSCRQKSKLQTDGSIDKPPIPGISYQINETERWPFFINKKKGWVCIGSPNIKNKQLIEFAPNCIATMEGQEIIAVWLHPKKLSSELFSY
jgi:hypothetical protein